MNTLDKRSAIPSCNYFLKVALPALCAKWEIERGVTAVVYLATTTDLWSSRTMGLCISLTIAEMVILQRGVDAWKCHFSHRTTQQSTAQALREEMAFWSLQEDLEICLHYNTQQMGLLQQAAGASRACTEDELPHKVESGAGHDRRSPGAVQGHCSCPVH